MNNVRIATVLTWAYSAGFGLSTVPVAIYLLRRGRLPVFAGFFETYGGPWSPRLPFVVTLGLPHRWSTVTRTGFSAALSSSEHGY